MITPVQTSASLYQTEQAANSSRQDNPAASRTVPQDTVTISQQANAAQTQKSSSSTGDVDHDGDSK